MNASARQDVVIRKFTSWDGTALTYRVWKPATQGNRALLLLHRGHEHSGRLQALVEDLGLNDFWAFGYDMRGHGQSPGERGYVENYDVWVRDLDAFARYIRDEYGIAFEDLAVIGNSVGAVTAATWLHDYAPRVRCVVMAAPAFDIKLYVPLAIPGLRLLHAIRPKSFVKSYVRSSMLTHDPDAASAYDSDELITRNIAVSVLLGLHDSSHRILADAQAINLPTLILSAGKDYVVKTASQRRFHARISSPQKVFEFYDDFHHAIFYEQGRHKAINRSRDFILQQFERPITRPDSFTHDEYDRLKKRPALPKRLFFGAQVLVLKTLGRLSNGIRLGWKTGFDSGASLDYVYENKAGGITPLGTLIDRVYLNAIGWHGVRYRRQNLLASIRDVANHLRDDELPLRVLDVATGPGRYLEEIAKELDDVHFVLRDLDPDNIRHARKLGLPNCDCAVGDAFDAKALTAIAPAPGAAIVSGLYELFPDNADVSRSLDGIAQALPDGGYLIYTGQPWHPQLEMIALTLINHRGEPWIMRRRPQWELDELVHSAGFEKLRTRVGPYGIFNVSIARKGSKP